MAGEIITLLLSKSHVWTSVSPIINNQLINQNQYLERVTAQRDEIKANK